MADPQQSALGQRQFLTEMDVRIWMRDKDPEANLLLDDFEYTSEEIRTAMTLTVDYWNDIPPMAMTPIDYTRFPWRSRLLCGTCANLLFMAAHRFRRNSLQYSAGGMTIADQEKYNQYDQAGGRLWEEYKQWAHDAKRSLNITNGWGTIP